MQKKEKVARSIYTAPLVAAPTFLSLPSLLQPELLTPQNLYIHLSTPFFSTSTSHLTHTLTLNMPAFSADMPTLASFAKLASHESDVDLMAASPSLHPYTISPASRIALIIVTCCSRAPQLSEHGCDVLPARCVAWAFYDACGLFPS